MQRQRDISEAFSQSTSGATIVNMMTLDLLVASGGVLSHAPRRNQTVMLLINASCRKESPAWRWTASS